MFGENFLFNTVFSFSSSSSSFGKHGKAIFRERERERERVKGKGKGNTHRKEKAREREIFRFILSFFLWENNKKENLQKVYEGKTLTRWKCVKGKFFSFLFFFEMQFKIFRLFFACFMSPVSAPQSERRKALHAIFSSFSNLKIHIRLSVERE